MFYDVKVSKKVIPPANVEKYFLINKNSGAVFTFEDFFMDLFAGFFNMFLAELIISKHCSLFLKAFRFNATVILILIPALPNSNLILHEEVIIS